MDRNAVFLGRIYQNARLTSRWADSLLSKTDDPALTRIIRREIGDCETYAQSARDLLAAYQELPEEPGVLDQAASWGSLQMNTLLDHTPDHLSQVLAMGLETGARELQNDMREFCGCDRPVTDLAQRLLDHHQVTARQLKDAPEGGTLS